MRGSIAFQVMAFARDDAMGEWDSLHNFREVPARARAGWIAGFIRCLLPAVLCCCLFPSAVFAEKTETLHIATGNKTGSYYKLGLLIKKALEGPDSNIKVVLLQTAGSIENARLIQMREEGEEGDGADLALIQNDVAHYFSTGERVFSFPSNEMQGIISLYTEFVHVLAKRSPKIGTIEELEGRHVAVGPKDSGTEFNAAPILATHGITYRDIRAEFFPSSDLPQAVADASIDAAFLTTRAPATLVTKLHEEMSLVALDHTKVTKLLQRYPFFLFTSIPANTYPEQPRAVRTVGVRALLVVRKGLTSDMVHRITRAVFTDAAIAVELSSSLEGIDRANPLKGMSSIELHPGARQYYLEQGILQRTITDHIKFILSIAIPILALVLFLRYRKRIVRLLRRNMTVYLATVFFFFLALGAILLHFFERNVNRPFETLPESFWSATAYIVSGFEDRPPVTSGGRVISVLMFVVAVSLFGLIAGKFASVFIRKEIRKMPTELNQQIIICNWSDKGDRIVKELHASQAEPDTEIIVITDTEVNEEELRKSSAYRNVYFVKSDPVMHSVLRASRVDRAKCVILLVDDESPDADAKSALIALAICRLCEQCEKKPHIVAQAKNHRKIRHLKDAGVEEVICSGDLGLGVLAQCALHAKLSSVYDQLLTYGDDTNEIYVVSRSKLPDWLVGHTYVEVGQVMNQNREPENPAILVGLRREGTVLLNPRRIRGQEEEERVELIEEGDALIVMAYDPPDLSGLPEPGESA